MRKAAVLFLLLSGCGSIIPREFTSNNHDFDFREPGCPPKTPHAEFSVRYLGSGGVYINWKNEGLLIGPYFSHSGGVGLAQFAHVHFDKTRIADGMQGINNVRAIVFGHSHFDHIADLPIVADKYVTDAPIYTNQSGLNLLEAYPSLRARAHSVEDNAPFEAGGFRIQPIKWGHAPQLCPFNIWPCTYATGQSPRQTKTWDQLLMRHLRGGQTYAYVIELLEGRDIRYRIYYNDAAAQGVGEGLPDGKYDLAIICMASFHFARDYPTTLLERLKPRHLFISHYEDFFTKQKRPSWTFPPLLTNRKAKRFMNEVRKAMKDSEGWPAKPFCGVEAERWSMPVPGETLAFQ